MLRLLARGSSRAPAAALLRAHSRTLMMSARGALTRMPEHSTAVAAVPAAHAHAASLPSSRTQTMLPLPRMARGFAAGAGKGKRSSKRRDDDVDPRESEMLDGEDIAAEYEKEAKRKAPRAEPWDELRDGPDPARAPKYPAYDSVDMDEYTDLVMQRKPYLPDETERFASKEEKEAQRALDEGEDERLDEEDDSGEVQATGDVDPLDAAEEDIEDLDDVDSAQAALEKEWDDDAEEGDESESREHFLHRIEEEKLDELEDLLPVDAGIEGDRLSNYDEDEERAEDSDEEPVKIDNKWIFEGEDGKPVDRRNHKLRQRRDYAEEDRETGEEFAGYTVSIRSKDGGVDEDHMGLKSRKVDEEEDEDEDEQQSDLEYDFEHDPDHHWTTEDALSTRQVHETENEYIYGQNSNPRESTGEEYRVDGEDTPPTVWQGRVWLTMPRTWENIRKNGKYPSEEEVEAHLKEVLGAPKPEIPINPLLPSKPQEYVWAPNLGPQFMDDSLLLSDAEWEAKRIADRKPRSWFVEQRIQYRRKLHLVRRKYLYEYRSVKAMHDANILARWAQQMENRKAKQERGRLIADASVLSTRDMQARQAARRTRKRLTSRFTRLNKEMKYRRHQLHMINYIIKERDRHWIQPSVDAAGLFVPNKNLSTKLFEVQSDVVGFWPKHPLDERKERSDEQHRRKAAKSEH